MTDVRGASSVDEEQEVDLASAWQRLTARWWMPAVGLFAGAVLGIALALAAGTVWQAATIVYLGQPFAPLGGGQIQSLATNPITVAEIVRSDAALEDVSDETGIPVRKLRASIWTHELLTPGQPRGINPLMEIGVKGAGRPRQIEQAANLLAERVVENVSMYVAEKVALLEGQVEAAETQLEEVNARIRTALEQQAEIIENRALPLEQRLLVTLNLNSVITTADSRRAAIHDDLFEARQLLNLAESVETSRVVEHASATKTTARSSRASLLVGALLGLLAGAVAALAAEPILARRRRSPAPA
jgi:uncharacterized protein involved in exopolysaccharide biosynthesis